MPFTNYFNQKILQNYFGAVAYASLGTLYVGLSTTTPTQVSTSNWNFTEPSGNGYARPAVTNNTTNWTAIASEPASGYTLQNGTTITFNSVTGTGWGTVTYFGIWDALTVGNLLGYGTVATQLLSAGLTPSFVAGALQITNN